MPQDCAYGVFEVGMNHAGEIDALVRMVRPHCAIITHVGTAHIEHFDSEADIARAKGEIFNDMANDVVEGGTVIIPADNPHIDLLVELAEARGIADIRRFSTDEMAAAYEPPHMVASKIYPRNMQLCQRMHWRCGSYLQGRHTRCAPCQQQSGRFGCCSAAGADLALAALSLAEVEAQRARAASCAGCCRWPLRVDR